MTPQALLLPTYFYHPSSSRTHQMPSSFSHPNQVTISLLPASLSLVHIPRSRLAQLSHPVLRQLLRPNPTFLNITCNEIELSLFAEYHMLEDFEPIARRDRQRQRKATTASSRRTSPLPSIEPVEVSYERWNVLQVDSHSDSIDTSGARVHEISAPLAAAGISILYQSSYMSDFIFVKESRLQEAMSLFTSAGFDLYPHEPHPMHSLSSGSHSSSSGDELFSPGHEVRTDGNTILTRSRYNPSNSLLFEHLRMHDIQTGAAPQPERSEAPARTPPLSRSKSHSPTSGEVKALSPDLTCVGLADESVSHWELKIVKLVAFPDLLPLREQSSTPSTPARRKTPSSRNPNSKPASLSAFSLGLPEASSDSSSDSCEDDGYFSHSPSENHSTSSLLSSSSRSYTDMAKPLASVNTLQSSSKHFVSSIAPLSPIVDNIIPQRPYSSHPILHTLPSHRTPRPGPKKMTVPFFSFTKTPEGSSLTADVSLLAELFPPSERHMVICSGELDAADERHLHSGYSDDDEEGHPSNRSTLKCLQIDLRRFGLDKYGLVNRFSRVLEENGINHMYSSTFKTANLLVDRKHALRAQSLLRSC